MFDFDVSGFNKKYIKTAEAIGKAPHVIQHEMVEAANMLREDKRYKDRTHLMFEMTEAKKPVITFSSWEFEFGAYTPYAPIVAKLHSGYFMPYARALARGKEAMETAASHISQAFNYG